MQSRKLQLHHSKPLSRTRLCALPSKHHIATLNKLFYDCPKLTSVEVQKLVNGRRLQFSHLDDGIELVIYPEQWNASNAIWKGMTDILNVWSVGDQLRHKLVDLKESDNSILVVPLITQDT